MAHIKAGDGAFGVFGELAASSGTLQDDIIVLVAASICSPAWHGLTFMVHLPYPPLRLLKPLVLLYCAPADSQGTLLSSCLCNESPLR